MKVNIKKTFLVGDNGEEYTRITVDITDGMRGFDDNVIQMITDALNKIGTRYGGLEFSIPANERDFRL